VLGVFALSLSLIVMLGTSTVSNADENDAKRILKSMSTYLSAQEAFSFDYDATLEVVTTEAQTLALASSGSVAIRRPDKLHITRHGGFADAEMFFDGKLLTLLGRNLNVYAQLDVPGTIDNLVDVLRTKYGKPLPAADLLISDSYEILMADVIDVKDLGSGVIGGVECDYLAFRTEEVDWQIWIAQGKHPHPCRFMITAKLVEGGPQYTIQFRNWRAGDAIAARGFTFTNPTKATKVDLNDIKGVGELPKNFVMGGSK
jgi:hypothetical protein